MRSTSILCLFLLACGGSDDADPVPEAPAEVPTTQATTTPVPVTPPVQTQVDDPGPKPAGCGDLQKNKDGFFTRTTSKSSYVGYVPASYTGAPMRLVVGLHGCGDSASNFATWGINPYDTRKKQDWIGITVDGASGGGSCWDLKKDVEKVTAAIADISSCVYVHQQRITLAGYSSGGDPGYMMAMKDAKTYAGLLIENSSISSACNVVSRLSGATRKINIAHRAHEDDQVYKLAGVEADWAKIKAAGFPIETSTVDGTHNGTGAEWSGWLLGKSAAWKNY